MRRDEVWFRNPELYIRECVEIGVDRIAWDRGYLVKKSIDAARFAELHFPAHVDYRLLLVGEQGTAELRRGSSLSAPTAVYPTWDYQTDTVADLEDMLANPAGEDETLCDHPALAPDEKPVRGQEHRVVVIRVPPANVGIGRQFIRQLRDLQTEYPDAILHFHGTYSWRVAFGNGFRSVDIDPRILAKKGGVILPSGREVKFELAAKTPQWVTLLGFLPTDLSVPRNRCIYNMKSAWWAAEHWSENLKFKSAGTNEVDPDAISHVPAVTRTVRSVEVKAQLGDRFLCDTCSLNPTCKYYRSGEVCSIPDSEPSTLARMFGTRDADSIIDALQTLLTASARRLERGIENEAEYNELDPEVTKIITSLFESGTKLAKLVDPQRFASKNGVNIHLGQGAAAVVANESPEALVSAAIRTLERRGINRADITSDLLQTVLGAKPQAIEASATEVARDSR